MKLFKRRRIKNRSASFGTIGKAAMIRAVQHEGILPYADITPRKENGKWVANVPKLRRNSDGTVTVTPRSRTMLMHMRQMDRSVLRNYLVSIT